MGDRIEGVCFHHGCNTGRFRRAIKDAGENVADDFVSRVAEMVAAARKRGVEPKHVLIGDDEWPNLCRVARGLEPQMSEYCVPRISLRFPDSFTLMDWPALKPPGVFMGMAIHRVPWMNGIAVVPKLDLNPLFGNEAARQRLRKAESALLERERADIDLAECDRRIREVYRRG